MATEIYLGNPPQHVIDWIKAHSKPVLNPKTKITFTDGTSQEYDWSDEITKQTMIDAGIFDENEYKWVKEPQTIEIGTQVTCISDRAFSTCTRLTSLTIPSSVTSISDQAFGGCSGLTSLTISESVTSIGEYAFGGCSGLTSLTISEGVTSIGSGAFSGCSGLTSVTIPSSVTSIGDWALGDCSNLINVTFSGKDNKTVKNMANYSWGLATGCVLHCTDGDITI